ncbi:MAG: di-trans,poly-cis-decaprenylcistransferase [Deltaproteobacteria bacterium]|jgi:undecaprenyl diphosphate synthase|nr:di-trans,poly-cis-decaprenylcistransferase [Deltaproteobacteria bacterium]
MNETEAEPEEPDFRNALPAHLGVIMDGNGRWATRRGLPRNAGHRAGAEAVRRLVTDCRKIGLKHLTLYTFSKENWSRPLEEITLLFGLLTDFLGQELRALQENDIKLNVFGESVELPLPARKALERVLARTANNRGMQLNLALNYSGREEIVRACRAFIAAGGNVDALTPEILSGYLYSAGQPDPDIIIRTSGEFRVSNFLLFQSAYSEYYVTEVLWPDFTEKDLHAALRAYSRRERRFGNI